MKSINARTTLKLAFCFYLFLGLALATQGQAGEYYTYRDPNGKLVISNKQPPPGSKIVRQQTLPDLAESDTLHVRDGDETRPNGNANSAKPSTQR